MQLLEQISSLLTAFTYDICNEIVILILRFVFNFQVYHPHNPISNLT